MKKLSLILAFCVIGFSASAQFWRFKRKAVPPILPARASVAINMQKLVVDEDEVFFIELPPSDYLLTFTEMSLIKVAKHNMRFRIYGEASYNFSDLAGLYIRQNRFSEAKWYLLQSNTIARNTQNSKHLIDNLLILADIKNIIGENVLAMADLQEAHDLAVAKDMQADLKNIDKKIKYLQNNKIPSAKAEMRYANAVEAANPAKTAPVN